MKTTVTPPSVLTPEEERERRHLELKAKRSLYEQGMALQRLRDRNLYRSTHTSWEEYVSSRFGMSKSLANRIIRAAECIEDIAGYYLARTVTPGHQTDSSMGSHPTPGAEEIADPRPQMVPSGHQQSLTWEDLPPEVVLPTQEKPLRSALDLPRELRGRAWELGLELNEGRPPSSAQMAQVVVRLKREQRRETPPPNPFVVGQICLVHPQNHPELRGLGGAPGTVIQVNEFSCQVRTGLGDRLIPCQNLEAFDCNAWEAEAMRDRLERLHRLSQLEAELDPVAQNILQQFSRMSGLQLTPFQEEVLAFLEKQYGLDGEAEEPAATPPPSPALEPLMTSPPAWAQEELGVTPEPGGTSFEAGDAVRVCEGHSHYPNACGVVTEVYEETSAAIVKLEGVRKPVVLPFVELVKITLSNGGDRRSHSRDRGSG